MTIVTGMPRSGTSMVMQALRAGGMEVVDDGARPPGVHNPRGYLEWQPLRRALEPGVVIDLRGFAGRAIKVIAPLLPAVLPRDISCAIIHVVRDSLAVATSQRIMLEAEGHVARQGDEEVAALLSRHRLRFERWLNRRANARVLACEYDAILRDPREEMQKIASLVELEDIGAMAGCVERELCHHHRGTTG